MKQSRQALACLRKAHVTQMNAIWMLPTAPYYNIDIYIYTRMHMKYSHHALVCRCKTHVIHMNAV